MTDSEMYAHYTWVHEGCGGEIIEGETNKGWRAFCDRCHAEESSADYFNQVRFR
jgi:hypothetical protein